MLPGTVSANGRLCVPNAPLSGRLAALNIGLACGTDLGFADVSVYADCPN